MSVGVIHARQGRMCLLVALTVRVATGCGPAGSAPVLDPLPDQVGYVGSQLAFELRASSSNPGSLTFSFVAADLPDLGQRATIRPYGDGSTALFTWTPLGGDVGSHAIDFAVTDGSHTATETITLTVESGEGAGDGPTFVEPLGDGTTLDLSKASCVDVDIEVTDPVAASALIDASTVPASVNGKLTKTGDFTSSWHWCPTGAQIAAQDRWVLVLTADDGQHPKAMLDYLIVLLQQQGSGCRGGVAPTVTHTPADASTALDLPITAAISDDVGLGEAPLLEYSAAADLSSPTLLTMTLASGDMQSGTWTATIPNPVASMPGASATIYYDLVAKDADDAGGVCDHTTTTDIYAMTVTNPGGDGNAAICTACTADAQCGGASDDCIRLSASGDWFCGTGCTSDSQCPTGDYCSLTALRSIDGDLARQCIPTSYSCTATMPTTCTDDGFEPDDSAATAKTLPDGTTASLVSCPDAAGAANNDDYYQIDLTADTEVTIALAGDGKNDLDLALDDDAGNVLQKMETLGSSSETITTCLGAGTYEARVYARATGASTYSLTVTKAAQACTAMCADDPLEPDDDARSATRVDLTTTAYEGTGQICADDDDWYRLSLTAGDELRVALGFTQASDAQDLDIHIYSGGVDLTPCTEADPTTCDASNGQSAESNENYDGIIQTTAIYYVVIRGWNHSQNAYTLCMSLQDGVCPVY